MKIVKSCKIMGKLRLKTSGFEGCCHAVVGVAGANVLLDLWFSISSADAADELFFWWVLWVICTQFIGWVDSDDPWFIDCLNTFQPEGMGWHKIAGGEMGNHNWGSCTVLKISNEDWSCTSIPDFVGQFINYEHSDSEGLPNLNSCASMVCVFVLDRYHIECSYRICSFDFTCLLSLSPSDWWLRSAGGFTMEKHLRDIPSGNLT